jgi:hypothetical protein
VTLDVTMPGMPLEEKGGSTMLKVMESGEDAITVKLRNDQLLVPLCSVLSPSFVSVV